MAVCNEDYIVLLSRNRRNIVKLSTVETIEVSFLSNLGDSMEHIFSQVTCVSAYV